jgi:L-seryl-tRNA(Ser) seleniumtransferase
MPLFSQSRRGFFTNAGLIGALGALPGGQRIAAAMAAKATQESMKVYTRLGLRPILNASGSYTHLGGSLMPKEVTDAMSDAAKHYVPIRDLVKATGERLVQSTWKPGSLVTTGAAGAIFVVTAVCIAANDPEKMNKLPFTDGMKNEVVVQPLHVAGWTRQCEAAGARLTVVEYKDQMERAVNERTAMIYFLVADKPVGAQSDVPNAT